MTIKMNRRKPVLGLALGGGGVRGLAHIGVLQVFEREGIEINCLSGTSMGGILAAAYAAGRTPEELTEESRRVGKLSGMLKLVEWEFPIDGLVSGTRVRMFLEELLGGRKSFEELSIPLALTAVDIRRAREVHLYTGDLIQAVSATIALPGVVEPVERDEELLVDGALLNNVPADLARALGAEVVVAVDVSPSVTDELVWQGMNMPHLARHVWRCDNISIAALTEAKLKQAKPELVLRPNLPSGITTLSGFRQLDGIIAAGEEAALKVLPRLRKITRRRLFWRESKLQVG